MSQALSSALQVRPWRGGERAALIVPTIEGLAPTVGALLDCVASLSRSGHEVAFTGALPPAEQAPFLAAGFKVHERLHLLLHDLNRLPELPEGSRPHRARRADRAEVLALDARAFDDFWQLDDRGLEDALRATPVSRFRLVRDQMVSGYAVCGRSGHRGYLQRLAVDPTVRRCGVGTALVVDGLRWLRRRNVRSVAVNTQEGNAAALALYERLGFRLDPHGLAVLSLDVHRNGR